MKQTFNVLFFIRKTKLKKSDDTPIMLRITIEGQLVEMQLKRDVKLNFWNQHKERCTGKCSDSERTSKICRASQTLYYTNTKPLYLFTDASGTDIPVNVEHCPKPTKNFGSKRLSETPNGIITISVNCGKKAGMLSLCGNAKSGVLKTGKYVWNGYLKK